MDARSHWENVYTTKAPEAVSWYRPHLEKSLEIVERVAPDRSVAIIDVGGGESTLVDDLLARGYQNVAVLDVSPTAIDVSKGRLERAQTDVKGPPAGRAADSVEWIVGDITCVELPSSAYDVWHDRAVFHFLTEKEQRAAYARQVARVVKPGGYVLVSTFGPEGPTKCSGLEVVR